MEKRIKIDLTSNYPEGTEIFITKTKDNIFDAWQGMKLFSVNP